MQKKDLISFRKKAIENLIKKNAISDQHQLITLLLQEYGIETNQAAISRDLRTLGVIKKNINGIMIYEVGDVDATKEILRLALIEINYNEVMIVIKTRSGLASFVGDYVDQQPDLEVIGCLAGENVVFVIPKSIKNIEKIYESVCESFHFKQKMDN